MAVHGDRVTVRHVALWGALESEQHILLWCASAFRLRVDNVGVAAGVVIVDCHSGAVGHLDALRIPAP